MDEESTLSPTNSEVEQDWVHISDGTLEDAKRKWGDLRTAVGRINVVRVPGKKDRMVMDSAVPGLTDKARQAEKPQNPNPESVNDSVANDTSG